MCSSLIVADRAAASNAPNALALELLMGLQPQHIATGAYSFSVKPSVLQQARSRDATSKVSVLYYHHYYFMYDIHSKIQYEF